MPFDTLGPLNYLVTLAGAIVDGAQAGVPEVFSTRLSCYVLVGEATMDQRTVSGVESGTVRRDQQYIVVLGYRVDGHEQDAELALATAQPLVIAALYADRTLGGTVKSIRVDTSLVGAPAYGGIGNQETRLYPIGVSCLQDHTI
ncbi:MAG TPA: hypothetical protein VII06_09635 [Chloroflexota bacterium]|jgi:hypothetical protein